MGGGSSPRSLSHAGVRRLFGHRLPDAILHGKRSVRSHSRTFQRLAVAELLSEASWPAWAGGCATGLRTRSRHVRDFCSASRPFCAGSATAFGSALAQCHGSDLLSLRLLFAHEPAVRFLHRRRFGSVPALPGPGAFPVRALTLSRLSAPFVWRTFYRRSARVACSVRAHSSNRIPSG
jgi:hypothetical protein